MQAGRLHEQIELQKFVSTTDGWGQPVQSWTPLATVWAAVEPLAGREFIAAQAAQSEVTARVRIRWRGDVDSQVRVVHRGKTYNVQSVIDPRSERKELILMVKG
ncbi:phage head closure protein [Pulveribacter suum]|uniref:Head-tail adaptor protein n=1 Tax=Pulveribacter suum TaxID=2116657 RepID=A0A2P1NJ98_9BURK|nr:phage head closure protein [Pulveribacter suum]AVP57096.1 head-tail adaptor protein [Pulveribacter suum]